MQNAYTAAYRTRLNIFNHPRCQSCEVADPDTAVTWFVNVIDITVARISLLGGQRGTS